MKWYIYIVECIDKSLYTGITTNIERRIKEHNVGIIGAKSVRGKLPVKLVYFEDAENQILAAKREREMKGWSRNKKLKLIQGFNQERRVYPEE